MTARAATDLLARERERERERESSKEIEKWRGGRREKEGKRQASSNDHVLTTCTEYVMVH